MGICNNKQSIQEPKSKRLQPMNTQQRLQPKASRVLDENYKQIPNKFKPKNIILANDSECEAQGLIGLTNLGNTCFLNSSIQTLSNTQPLTDYFTSQLHLKELNPDNPLSSKGEITQVFATLVRHLWQKVQQSSYEDKIVIRPQTLILVIERYNPIFGAGTQEDAHEFIGFLLDMIHEDLNRIKKKPYVEEKTLTSWPTSRDAQEAWLGYLSRNQSIIVDLFQGHMLNTLECQTCQTARYRFEPFMYMSVPVPPSTCDLSDCIQEFLKKEVLSGNERWHCPKCQQDRDSVKKIDLWTMPNLLIIHLKRFKFNQVQRCKLRTLVKYPLNNLSFERMVCVEQEVRPTYDLYAVINHSGTLTSGHYTSYAKNRDDLHWYHYNDSYVTPVHNPEEQVVSNDGYLLFYFKNSVEEFKRQTMEGVNASLRRKTIKNTIMIKQTMLNLKSKESLSNISKAKKSQQQHAAPSISQACGQGRMLQRKQTKHYQKIKVGDNSNRSQPNNGSSIIVEDN